MARKKDEQVDVSKRMFFKRTVQAVGGAAAAGVAATGVTRAVSASSRCAAELSLGYESDDRRQERLVRQGKLVLMSDDEKQKMLDEIIKHHHSEIA